MLLDHIILRFSFLFKSHRNPAFKTQNQESYGKNLEVSLTKTPKYHNVKNQRVGKIPQIWGGEEIWVALDGLEQLYIFQPKILKFLSKYCSEKPAFSMGSSYFQ